MGSNPLVLSVLVPVLIWAMWTDLMRREIPNGASIAAAAAIVAGAFLTGSIGQIAWESALLILIVGFILSAFMGVIGAGDVKLLAALSLGFPGALISRSIPAGSAIEPSALVFRDDPEFLSAVLEPGMRAFTIEVDAVTGGAGLLRPGNRVDVILASQTDPKKARGTIRTYDVAQTLLTNMRVIAVDRTIEPVGFSASKEPQDPKAQRAAAAQTSPSRKGTVTLEVTPKDAEVLTVARSAGQLSLTLCDASGEAPRTTGSRRAVTAIRDIVPVKTEAAEVQEVKTYYGASTEPPQM